MAASSGGRVSSVSEALSLNLVPYKHGMMVNVCNPSTQDVEAGGSEVKGHPWLPREFGASLGYK